MGLDDVVAGHKLMVTPQVTEFRWYLRVVAATSVTSRIDTVDFLQVKTMMPAQTLRHPAESEDVTGRICGACAIYIAGSDSLRT